MERNDGHALEDLVRMIEGHLVPQGFKIETRKPVLDDDGVQIAEFDILITGNIGSGHIAFLIECRDRPSEGPAPGGWIEQLIGRRCRFRLNKVMAVSSTGFAKGAVKAAAEGGIELRELQSLGYEAVADWLPRNAPVVIRHGYFHAVRCDIPDPTSHGDRRVEVSLDEPILVGSDSGEKISVRALWRRLVNTTSVWKGIREGGPPVEVTVRAGDHLSEGFSAEIENRVLGVRGIEFEATLHAYFPVMPFVEAATYSMVVGPDGQQTFAQMGRWGAPEGSLIRGLTIIGISKRRDEREDSA